MAFAGLSKLVLSNFGCERAQSDGVLCRGPMSGPVGASCEEWCTSSACPVDQQATTGGKCNLRTDGRTIAVPYGSSTATYDGPLCTVRKQCGGCAVCRGAEQCRQYCGPKSHTFPMPTTPPCNSLDGYYGTGPWALVLERDDGVHSQCLQFDPDRGSVLNICVICGLILHAPVMWTYLRLWMRQKKDKIREGHSWVSRYRSASLSGFEALTFITKFFLCVASIVLKPWPWMQLVSSMTITGGA